MNLVAYGVKISSPRSLPVDIPDSGNYRQNLRLRFVEKTAPDAREFRYRAPTIQMHNRSVCLMSNLPTDSNRRCSTRSWKLTVDNLFAFDWSNNSDELQITCGENSDMELITFWLLHTVIPVYLMLKENNFFLHASTVVIDNKAVLLVAPSHGGKSTLANYFTEQGYRFLSDDKIRLSRDAGEFEAFPSHPYRRPFRKPEVLGNHCKGFETTSLPVHSIFALKLIESNGNLRISLLDGLEKFEVVKGAYLYEPASLTRLDLENIFKLLPQCSLYKIEIPTGLEHLHETARAMLRCLRASK